MARNPTSNQSKASWWNSLPEKFTVALVTAMGTVLVTMGGPALKDYAWKTSNKTNLSEKAVAFQQSMWLANNQCVADPSAAMWHDSDRGRKIDAVICPETGDIVVTMRDRSGRLVQGFADLSELKGQYEMHSRPVEQVLREIGIGSAYARESRFGIAHGGGSQQLAQTVMCQMMMQDGRSLRRRLAVGPNQCVEILIDTFTGRVIYQRAIPCVPNCAQNV